LADARTGRFATEQVDTFFTRHRRP
jgi:hypothetical protein